MRTAALVLASACLLAACNPSAPSSSGGAFPDLTSGSYRAEANIIGEDGVTLPVVMYRDGRKMRMELTTPAGPTVMIVNPDTGDQFVITSVAGRQMAMRISDENNPVSDPAAEWSGEMTATATRTGDCNVAGESGVEWTRPATEGDAASTACVTHDGIILRGTEGERTTWETTRVQRGPQSADLFALPAGVEVMDLGAIMAPASPNAPGGGDLCTTLRNAGAPADALARAGC